MKKYILSLDQGTTSSRALLFDRSGSIVCSSQYEYKQLFPKAGFVEHDPYDILSSQMKAVSDCTEFLRASGGDMNDISAIGITNQRETTVIWDRNTGKPVYNAIVWQCRRTADICQRLKGQGLDKFFREKTGLIIDPYFSATKIKWILDNVDGVRRRAENGELLFGTVDTWLIWNLTGGASHVTDYSNASRTMLYNIQELCWDIEILGLLGIPGNILPKVCPSSGVLGTTDKDFFGAEIPICGCAGDQQAALFGQCCFDKGDVKNTYGTGGFLLMNTGTEPAYSRNGLLTTIAWGINGKTEYALEGSVFVSGAAIKWLRDELCIINSADQTADIARSIPDNGGVYFVPAFTGLGTPYWDDSARGLICGMTRGTGKAHIVRAALEAIAYHTADVIKAMEDDTSALNRIKTDGGASQNDFLMQFQADILNRDIIRPENIESTATGAAFLAGLGCGMWKDRSELCSIAQRFTEFSPSMDENTRSALIKGWKGAVKRTIG